MGTVGIGPLEFFIDKYPALKKYLESWNPFYNWCKVWSWNTKGFRKAKWIQEFSGYPVTHQGDMLNILWASIIMITRTITIIKTITIIAITITIITITIRTITIITITIRTITIITITIITITIITITIITITIISITTIPTIAGYLHNAVKELDSRLPRTTPGSSRVEDLNQGRSDFKSSAL